MKGFLIVILICMPFLGTAQGAGLWTSANVEKKLNKSFSVNLSGQMRFADNASVLRSYLGEAGLEYKLNKYFGASLYYRYIGKRKQDRSSDDYYYRQFHRFYGNVTFESKLTKWLKFEYRFRYQNQFKDDESGLTNSGSYFRHKAEFTYKNKSRFSPYLSADIFYLLGTGFEQIRYKTGCNISLNKRNSFDLSVFADKAIVGGATDPAVISLAYKLKMK